MGERLGERLGEKLVDKLVENAYLVAGLKTMLKPVPSGSLRSI